MADSELDLQGHRGARGLLPENTLPGFYLAIDQGMTTLELDCAVTRDGIVVASHEPWFSAAYSNKPNGEPVTEAEEREHNIYELDYASAMRYDVGSRRNPRFPEQRLIAAHKPQLATIIAKSDEYARENGKPSPRYNIEVKSRPEWDGVFTPPAHEFALLVAAVVDEAKLGSGRATIQSFDVRALQALREWSQLPGPIRETNSFDRRGLLSLLVENNDGVEANLERLGFDPDIDSPSHHSVDAEMVEICHARGIQVIPWTVNERARMEELVALGVDGIITDYPDRARGLTR